LQNPNPDFPRSGTSLHNRNFCFATIMAEHIHLAEPTIPILRFPGFNERRRNIMAFWFLGLMNNGSYVVMNAGATEIAKGGVSAVYLANIIPAFLIKITAPYWFDRVTHIMRVSFPFLPLFFF
jgi:hypothetical protein